MNKINKQTKLNDLYKIYQNCDNSNPLYINFAKQFVGGYGNCESSIVFIGEAPGDIEEQTGLPFQGRSGQLLRQSLKNNNFTDKNIFITNVVKFRPPQNRKPTEQEIKTHYNLILFHELKIINPKIIITVGSVASETILQKTIKITAIRGKIIEKNNKIIIPLFHPAYILRNMNLLNIFENDIKNIKILFDEIEKGHV